jgi:hypothetical protein
MYSDNKQIRDVADAAAKIMYGQQTVTEKLHPNQQQLDVVDDEKIDGKDFAKLRAKKEVKKEDVEQVDEIVKIFHHTADGASLSRSAKNPNDAGAVAHRKAAADAAKTARAGGNFKFKGNSSMTPLTAKKSGGNVQAVKSEEVEQMDEVKMADLPSTRVQGRSYGASKPEPHAVDVMKGPKEKELKDIEAEKKKKKFSEMVNLYQEKGLKSLSEMLVKEEPDNEQYTKELEDAKAKDAGKKKNNGIGKAAPISTASFSEEIEIESEVIEEKHMTDAEMNKREDIVKSMKKGMAGFKDRYGDRAKDVMYATATKQAMK